jgi:hypothetical protein
MPFRVTLAPEGRAEIRLDFSKGMPPTLSVVNTDSLGEQIQRSFPEAKVVKTLHTMNAYLMVDPAKLVGAHRLRER